MKKNRKRILGRRVARELSNEDLRHANGGGVLIGDRAADEPSVQTWTTSYPPDSDPKPKEGPIWV
jgi:hypothetical protein